VFGTQKNTLTGGLQDYAILKRQFEFQMRITGILLFTQPEIV